METLVLRPRSDKNPCSEALQKALDKVGTGMKYDALSFGAGIYPVDLPLELNTGTFLTCSGEAVIKLIDNAPTNIWKSMTPVLGQAQKTVSDITIEKVTFDGNGAKQKVAAGDGFHNFIWLQNAANITVHNIKVKDSKGDGLRVKNGKTIRFYKNYVYHCGHDGLYVDGGSDVQAWENEVWLRTNSALRLRAVTEGTITNNTICNDLGSISSGPGIQIENPAGKKSSNIVVQGNKLNNVNGPGIWAIGVGNKNVDAARGLKIIKNQFNSCGMEPAGVKVPGVAGIVADGWNELLIEENEFEGCRGYGVLFGRFQAVAAGSGYKATVRKNVFKNTAKAFYAGVVSGTAVANLKGKAYTVTCQDNTFSGNVRNYYGI